jgi:hypothetical protein
MVLRRVHYPYEDEIGQNNAKKIRKTAQWEPKQTLKGVNCFLGGGTHSATPVRAPRGGKGQV